MAWYSYTCGPCSPLKNYIPSAVAAKILFTVKLDTPSVYQTLFVQDGASYDPGDLLTS